MTPNSTFEKLLRQIFCDNWNIIVDKPTYFNKTCYGEIDETLRLKAYIDTAGVHNTYECIRLAVINRTGGEVDRLTIHFNDIWGIRNGQGARIDKDGRDVKWFGFTPNREDVGELREAIKEYVNVFKKKS